MKELGLSQFVSILADLAVISLVYSFEEGAGRDINSVVFTCTIQKGHKCMHNKQLKEIGWWERGRRAKNKAFLQRH